MSGQSPVTGSLFAPFFFPLGIAFMGAQSAVMMKMAGENWQYGKRRISAMSNEDFNKMTPIKLYQIETAELQAIIPSIESSLQSMTPLTATIVTEMLNTFKVGAQATGAYLNDILNTPLGNIIKGAIVIWMPWLIPLMDKVPDLLVQEEADKIEVIDFPQTKPPEKEKKPPKTKQELDDEFKKTQDEIDKKKDPKMKQYTTFLNKIVNHNQRITSISAKIQQALQDLNNGKITKGKYTTLHKLLNQKLKLEVSLKKQTMLHFNNWKKNNKGWLSNNNLE